MDNNLWEGKAYLQIGFVKTEDFFQINFQHLSSPAFVFNVKIKKLIKLLWIFQASQHKRKSTSKQTHDQRRRVKDSRDRKNNNAKQITMSKFSKLDGRSDKNKYIALI